MNTPTPLATPAAASAPNKASLVIGGLGLMAIGALAAVLLLGGRTPAEAPPVAPAAVPVAAAPASAPAVEAPASAPLLALPAETPASAAVVEPAPPPVAAKTAAPAHAKKSRPAAAPAGDGSVAAKDAAEGSGWAGAPPVEAPRAICASCGVVESVTPVQHAGQGSGLGAVAGGVLGGLVGHQAGGGRGKDAMTVIGAIGGGLAGHEIEKRQRSTTAYEVQVRMEDGSRRSFTREQAMVVGQRVQVEGDTLAIDRSSPGKP